MQILLSGAYEYNRPIAYPWRHNNRGFKVNRTFGAALALAFLWSIQSPAAWAQHPFLSDASWSTLRDEASGTAPYENLRALTRLHHLPATAEFDQAAALVLERAKEYGLQDVHAEQFPIDEIGRASCRERG